jgi:hypothetical protein
MDLVERPVLHPMGAESTAVADPVLEDAPCVTTLALVLLECMPQLGVVIGALLPDPERFLARP